MMMSYEMEGGSAWLPLMSCRHACGDQPFCCKVVQQLAVERAYQALGL